MKIEREALYRRVWVSPVTHIAKEWPKHHNRRTTQWSAFSQHQASIDVVSTILENSSSISE